MTVAVVILGLAVMGILVLQWQERLRMTEAWDRERAKLLDRIQHPESRQVEAGEQIIHEPPRDEAELAYVGGFVPDGISVGSTDE